MRTVLIVDDEKIEREGVKRLIRREDTGVRLIEAVNGKQGLELAEKEKPDLVFTDIKMPFLSGLGLAEKIREICPETAIVIFTGYSDFEYAKTAMKNGVTDYLLKPVDPVEFHETFQRMMKQIEDRDQKNDIFQKNQDFLEEFFLQKLLHSGKPEVMLEAAEVVDISWWKKIRRILLLETAGDFFETAGEDFPQKLKQELRIPFHYLNLETDRSVLLFEEGNRTDFSLLGQQIHEYILRRFQTGCYVAVSSLTEPGMHIPEGFQEADLLMEHKFYHPEKWVFLPDAGPEGKGNSETVNQLLEKMRADISLKDITHLWEHYHKFSELRKDIGQFSHIYVKFSCSNILMDLYKDMNQPAEKCNEIIEKLYLCSTIQEILDILEETIRLYEETVFSGRSGVRGDVEKIKSYIYEHYAQELSVEILRQHVYLSAGYMSYIFKKETGVGLSHFIRVFRLEKAKTLLETTDKKINQICIETGFTNASYFCKNFREYYGISPEKFRKGAAADEEAE